MSHRTSSICDVNISGLVIVDIFGCEALLGASLEDVHVSGLCCLTRRATNPQLKRLRRAVPVEVSFFYRFRTSALPGRTSSYN
jgi:hypothetical protein